MTRKEAERLYADDFETKEELDAFLNALEGDDEDERRDDEDRLCGELADERAVDWYD